MEEAVSVKGFLCRLVKAAFFLSMGVVTIAFFLELPPSASSVFLEFREDGLLRYEYYFGRVTNFVFA